MTQPAYPPPVGAILAAARGAAADGPSDAELLGRFADGRDEAAFELLVWRHAVMVHRTCRDVLRDHHAAEDVTQAAFLVLAKKAHAIGRREAVAGWLYRVARRMAVRHAAKLAKAPAPTDRPDDWPAPARETDADGPRLLAEVAQLPEAYRVPVLLCYFEGLTHADAAARLNWPVGTVAGRLSRAKDVLRERLLRRGGTVTAAFLTGAVPAAAPAAFIRATTRAAVAAAAGESLTPLVPAATAALVKGTLSSMAAFKFKVAAGVTAALAVGGGAVILAQGPGPGTGGGFSAPPGGPAMSAADAPKGGTADPAQRRRSLNNLKQIMLAILNYEAAYGKLPQDVVGKDGKPLLSWRIELLPFLEQTPLYNQFNRAEPWDGETNLKLLAKMPDVFRVGFEPVGATHTYYQRVEVKLMAAVEGADGPGAGARGGAPSRPGSSGAGAAPPSSGGPGGTGSSGGGALIGGGLRIGADGGLGTPPDFKFRFPVRITEIADGVSNTIGLVEAGPPAAWTKPTSFRFDPDRAPPIFNWPFANTNNVALYDASARTLRPNGLSPKHLAGLLHPSDGLVLPDLSTARARFPAETAADKAELQTKLDESKALLADIEREIKEHVRLYRLRNSVIVDLDKADEELQSLQKLLDSVKAKNKNLRDGLGIRK